MTKTARIIAYILAGIVGLAALITSMLYDWSNKEPGEGSLRPAVLESTNS